MKEFESSKNEVVLFKTQFQNLSVREKSVILEVAASICIEHGEGKIIPLENFPNSYEIPDMNSFINLRSIYKKPMLNK